MATELSYEYLQPPSEALDCPICRATLLDPVIALDCQHVFCRACLSRALLDSRTCPIDRSPIEQSRISKAPGLVRAMLDELAVSCTACEWQGRREDWEKHVDSHESPDSLEVSYTIV